MCSHICQVCTRLKHHSPTFPVCVCTVKNSRFHRCFSWPGCHLLLLTCQKRSRSDSLQPLDHGVSPCGRATEVDESSCCPSQSATNKISIQHCRGYSASPRLRYHDLKCTVVKGMQWMVCWICYGFMRCQDETVARMCNYISVCAYKTEHVQQFCTVAPPTSTKLDASWNSH